WRYALDPPEFFTALAGDTDKLHWGYYLDDPGAGPSGCVAYYYAADAFDLSVGGDTLFEAVRLELEYRCADLTDYLAEDPGRAARRVRLRPARRGLRRPGPGGAAGGAPRPPRAPRPPLRRRLRERGAGGVGRGPAGAGYWTRSSWTSKTSVALGGMATLPFSP